MSPYKCVLGVAYYDLKWFKIMQSVSMSGTYTPDFELS